MIRTVCVGFACAVMLVVATMPDGSAADPEPGSANEPAGPVAAGDHNAAFQSIDKEVQELKKDVLDLNKDLFLLEEELLFPANSQVAFFISLDVGNYFELDSIKLRIDDKEVANYLYTEREVAALMRGGVHRLYMGNLKVGEHELVAIFTGQGPHTRDYRRGADFRFRKGIGSKYVELKISDKISKQQPEFEIREWE